MGFPEQKLDCTRAPCRAFLVLLFLLVSLTLAPEGGSAALFLNSARQWCSVCPPTGQPLSNRYVMSAFCCGLFNTCCPQGTGLNPYRQWQWN